MKGSVCILLFTLLFAVPIAQAQVSVGAKVGGSLTSFRFHYDNSEIRQDPQLLPRFTFGLILNWQLNDLLAFQPQVLYSGKGAGFNVDSFYWALEDVDAKGSSQRSINYLEVPVNVVLSFGEPAKGQFQVFAGPYIAYALSGIGRDDWEATYTIPGTNERRTDKVEERTTLRFGSENSDHYRKLDYGLNVGVGFRISLIQAQVGYGLGLANLFSSDQLREDARVSNSAIHASLALLLGR